MSAAEGLAWYVIDPLPTATTNYDQVVEHESAKMDIPNEIVKLLDASHTDLCKFVSSSDDNWVTVTTYIHNMASNLVNRSCKLMGIWYPNP